MAAPVVVSTQNPAGGLPTKFYEFLAQNTHRVADALRGAEVRVIATTDSATAGEVVNLNDQGFTFPDQTLTIVRARAWGRGADATEAQYIETVFLVIGQATTPVIANATSLSADAGTVAGTLLGVVTSNEVTIQLKGQASQAMNWVVEFTVDEPVGIVKGS